MNSDQTFGIVVLLILTFIFGFVKLLKGPVGQGLARRLGGSIEEERDQPAEISALRARIAELEERVDFTERMLLQYSERAEIPREGSQP